MSIEFINQRITITIGPRRGEVGPQPRIVDGIVGVGTDMACHAAIDKTILKQNFPNVWLVSTKIAGSIEDSDFFHHCVPTNPLPEDEETAKLLLSELHIKNICPQAQSDVMKFTRDMEAAGIGRWVWISPKNETLVKK